MGLMMKEESSCMRHSGSDSTFCERRESKKRKKRRKVRLNAGVKTKATLVSCFLPHIPSRDLLHCFQIRT